MLDEEEIQQLRDRWNSQIVNEIVIALNEGEPIDDILKKVTRAQDDTSASGRMDLRGIDLSHQNLRGPWKQMGDERRRIGIKLPHADFTGADLSWAILPRADFRRGIFRDADLSNAELIHTDFSEADLTGAVLQGAWLLDTKFYGAKVMEEQLHKRRNLGQLDFDYHAYVL
jgi:uncharacterized protein YjbI with pentapeptide repeats